MLRPFAERESNPSLVAVPLAVKLYEALVGRVAAFGKLIVLTELPDVVN